MGPVLPAPLVLALLASADPDAVDPGLEAAAVAAGLLAPRATLTELVREPELRLGERVRGCIVVAEPVETWEPFLTRFDPAAYRAVRCWSDEQPLWDREAFDAPAGVVFARRGTVAELVLACAEPRDRLVVELVVTELHAGRGWVEVVDARRARRQVPEGTVLHAIRALDALGRDAPRLAADQLERALAPPLPRVTREALEALRAGALESVRAREASAER